MRRYLVVDDNAELAENVAEILCDLGDHAVGISDPKQALELLKAERFDALITDLQMPLMNGLELVRAAREFDARLPVLAMTAYAGDSLVTAAQQQGLLGVLPKPVPIEQLLALARLARRTSLVLLVEDDAALSENLAEVLRMRGLCVAVAANLAALERMIGELRPSLALVDLKVVGGNAGDALAKVVAKFPLLPVVVMSAFHELRSLALNRPFVEKPFDTPALLATIETLVAAGCGEEA